ncbi:MAG: DUF4190 domain-containing protein [Phycisphaeraceae bacterium]
MADTPQQTTVHVHHVQSNGMGTAAGVCSIIGLVSCGLLCPIGLVLGLMSMKKEPNGMAITGVVLGAIGSLIYAIIFIFFGGALLVACGGCIGIANMANELAEQRVASQPAADAIVAYYETNDKLPDDATVQQLLVGLEHEGHAFRFKAGIDGSSFTLEHPGDDGQWNTADDWQTDWDAVFDSFDPFDDALTAPILDPSEEIDIDTDSDSESANP